jgi:hypothetical protein
MLTAIFAASLATFDYSCRAQRIEVALADLAKTTDLKLVVSSDLRDEVVIIDVHSAGSDQLLDKIAFVLRADWHTHEGVRVLERDSARRTRNDREDEQALKTLLTRGYDEAFDGARKPIPQQSIEQLALDLSLAGKLGEREDEARMEWYAIDPLIRAIPKLIDGLDWSVVRRSWGAQAVFASRPAVFEIALDRTAAQKAFAGIVQDVKAIKAVCDRREVKLAADWGTSQWERTAAFAAGDGARLYLRTALPFQSVGITVTDANGSEWLTQGTGSARGPKFPAAEEVGFEPRSVVDAPFFSDRTMRFADLVRDHRKLPDAELLAELVDPLEFDPHSYADTDFVRALNTQLKANVVVALSDLDRIVDYSRGRRDGSLVESLVPFLDLHQTKLEDGWLTARPKVLAGHEYAKLDRRVFAKMLSQLKTKGTLELVDFATAMSPAPSFTFWFITTYIRASAPKYPTNDDYDGAPLEFGSFLRALTEPERQRALTTGLSVKSLGPRATDAFRFHIWPVVEAQVTHDPDNPRPYHGWMHPLTLPPDDLTAQLRYQDVSGGAVRAVFFFSSSSFKKPGEIGFSFPTGER